MLLASSVLIVPSTRPGQSTQKGIVGILGHGNFVGILFQSGGHSHQSRIGLGGSPKGRNQWNFEFKGSKGFDSLTALGCDEFLKRTHRQCHGLVFGYNQTARPTISLPDLGPPNDSVSFEFPCVGLLGGPFSRLALPPDGDLFVRYGSHEGFHKVRIIDKDGRPDEFRSERLHGGQRGHGTRYLEAGRLVPTLATVDVDPQASAIQGFYRGIP